MHYTRNNTCIHANHIREYQSQLWNNFSSLRTLQRSLIQTANLCNTVHGAIFIPKIYKSRSRDRRKNQSTAQFPEHINQTAANQSNDPLFPRRFRKSDIRFCRNVTKLDSSFPTKGHNISVWYRCAPSFGNQKQLATLRVKPYIRRQDRWGKSASFDWCADDQFMYCGDCGLSCFPV